MSSWPSVRASWAPFIKQFEGYTNHLYQDTIGLITTGIGNLLDTEAKAATPTNTALSLPWTVGDAGPPATPDQVAASWAAVR